VYTATGQKVSRLTKDRGVKHETIMDGRTAQLEQNLCSHHKKWDRSKYLYGMEQLGFCS
jgi:hypothetical protein